MLGVMCSLTLLRSRKSKNAGKPIELMFGEVLCVFQKTQVKFQGIKFNGFMS